MKPSNFDGFFMFVTYHYRFRLEPKEIFIKKGRLEPPLLN